MRLVMTIEAQSKDYIAKNLLFSSDGFNYPDEASFLEEGIVDSQGVMELVLFALSPRVCLQVLLILEN